MQTWAMWTFGLLAVSVIVQVLSLAFLDYPKKIDRKNDCVSLLMNLAWLAWGLLVIWG